MVSKNKNKFNNIILVIFIVFPLFCIIIYNKLMNFNTTENNKVVCDIVISSI